jgi:hypothetical protein
MTFGGRAAEHHQRIENLSRDASTNKTVVVRNGADAMTRSRS